MTQRSNAEQRDAGGGGLDARLVPPELPLGLAAAGGDGAHSTEGLAARSPRRWLRSLRTARPPRRRKQRT